MIPLKMLPQPDDQTCGPTSLHAVYSYFGDTISLEQVIREMTFLEGGGTLAVLLGCHALKRGYTAKIYTYNLLMFDPTWFKNKDNLSEKLTAQKEYKPHRPKLQKATQAYLEFLSLGGELAHENLTTNLLNTYFHRSIPILAGLSATYLYECARECGTNKTVYDDLRGEPSGHFVVLCGHDDNDQKVIVADPYLSNPVSNDHYYRVQHQRLINAIMLGILTFDANILIIEPKQKK